MIILHIYIILFPVIRLIDDQMKNWRIGIIDEYISLQLSKKHILPNIGIIDEYIYPKLK